MITMGPQPKYSIDSSALIHGWIRAYPPDNFAPVWKRMDVLIKKGELVASIEVLHDLKRKADDLYEWCLKREDMFIEIDEAVQHKMAEIMGKYAKLVDTSTGKSGSDPFVIAIALTHNPQLTVVTEEKGGSERKPKMPYVCQRERIRCISLLDLIQEQDWKF